MTPIQELASGQDRLDDEATDRSLLRRFRRGSEDAATQLYLRYAQRLRDLVEANASQELVRNMDTEDIVQSVFDSFFRKAREGYYDVPDGEELWKLFLVIALNKIRAKANFYRAAKRDVRRTAGAAEAELSLKTTAVQPDSEYAFLEVIFDDALKRLPREHQVMVQLRLEGYAVAEIAHRSGYSKRTVERLLQESRKKLTALFQEDN